jgi:prepilin-type N-terminal cleavage/methylation domain-containing protein
MGCRVVGRRHIQCGFTLVEIAIVLFIVGLLTRTLLEPIAIAQKHRQFDLTRSELQQVKDSVHAHLVAHGYLPCPHAGSKVNQLSSDHTSGVECEVLEGSVPAVLLGLSGAIDSNGSLLDVWNRPYRYAVSLSNHTTKGNQRFPDWTTRGEASNVGLRYLSSNLVLCVEPSQAACAKNKVRANNLAFVVLSLGQDVSASGAQLENQDGDETYIINPLSIRADSPFDDQIVWSSTQDVLYWMLRAGWLP